MRLDKFLKVSRIIKRRSVAKAICDSDRVLVNDHPARAGKEIDEGDILRINLPAGVSSRILTCQVLSIPKGNVSAAEASSLYRVISDEKTREDDSSSGKVLSIIQNYTREAGVRNLEREIASVCRKVAKKIVREDQALEKLEQGAPKPAESKKTIRITNRALKDYLGVPKYTHGKAEEKDQVGVATGLAYTELGGDVLAIEAITMDGGGNLVLTGKLGDVMQESAKAALSYIKSKTKELSLIDLPSDLFSKLDIHIHIPEGAVPKDGPSAGITMATAMVSALTRRPVRKDIAMTGEITLRGRVLPIGGLKEKVLAALRADITNIIIPRDNEKDLSEIPQEIRKKMSFHLVDNMDKVLELALEKISRDG